LREYTLGLTSERELDLLRNTWAWGVFSGSQLGLPGKLALASRVSTAVLPSPGGATNTLPATPDTIVVSDTAELRWDLSKPGKGLVTIDTPRTKAVAGFADNTPLSFGGVRIQPGTTRLGWCTLGLTLIRGESFTNDCSALIVAGGWWENTGQVWKDASKTSVGNRWGQAPVLAEVVPFSLTLPVGTNHVRVWALDERGQRKAALNLSGDAASSTLNVTANNGSIWYELEVAPRVAGFDQWRARYFSQAELALPAMSGPAAAPDGDGVPNLWKYYLGLPGKTAAEPKDLPFGRLLALGDQKYLAMTFTRDKLAGDLDCLGEVSPDLRSWLSGESYTRTESRLDLGGREQVTVRDLEPLGMREQRFMRLRLHPPR
jgi:hypothetical protein